MSGASATGGSMNGGAAGSAALGGTGPSGGSGPSGGTGAATTGGTAPVGSGGAAGLDAAGRGGTGGGNGGMSGASSGGGVAGGAGADPLTGLRGTPSRPTLTPEQAAYFTVLAYLARTGSVTAPTTDAWDPTAGVGDVSTFTPMFTVAASGGTHTTVQAAVSAAVGVGGTARAFIRVMPGTYRELVCIPTNAPPITLYSTSGDASETTIVYDHLAGSTVDANVNRQRHLRRLRDELSGQEPDDFQRRR
jgi:pectinesterase